MPSAYLIADVAVHDPAAYEEYKRLSTLAMQAHGATVCIRGGAVEVLEGDWRPERVVMLHFPSLEQARAFHDSPQYRLARSVREPVSTMRMIIVEGV